MVNYGQLSDWFDLKAEAFNQAGYSKINGGDIRCYFECFAWKHESPKFYYQQVQAILKLEINQYFDYASLDAQVYSVQPLSEMNLSSIL